MTNLADSSDEVDRGWDDVPVSVTAPPPPDPSDIQAPNFRRRQVNPAVIVAAIGAAVALIVASVASPQFPSVAAPRHEIDGASPPEAPLAPAPARPRPESVPPVPAASGTSAEQPPIETARENAVTVTVKVFPENSVIFRAGEKLGYGAVQVSVEHDSKQRLTALHDGYLPVNFTLDGSRETVVVRLRHVPSAQSSAVPANDSPSSDADAPQGAPPPAPGEADGTSE